ncbi:cadmium resistance transporter [Levilactobacillus acidifarinae]|uniref:Integral membrane protein n=1 Tax=Levilactobacillus acidifarinae DSM 19394 = JCM 15949 TaxID=1423715 RepID=A0A0R1LPP4_9LACO|nr:cadmium resistance transporter [Levilactobacillus acidifarinae]KRK95587.1 integral membrane protein [Levilactobacillus acidifarinae DSM 19394]GEO69323.1 membrane protein [Levilactobacillus acidifarinae]
MNYWLLTLTFLSVNLDFFFMLIFLLKKYRVWQVMVGYLLGNLILLTASFFVGKTLTLFLPEWLLGVLGFLPIWLAIRDDDDDDQDKTRKSPVVSVLVTYLSVCAGCNLSIFLPVLVGETMVHFLMTLVFIGILTLIVVVVIKLIADISVVERVMERHGERLMKVCYVLIGLYVFWDSGLISHLIALF